MKRDIFSDPFQCKPDMAFFYVISYLKRRIWGYFISEIKYGNFKINCILANEHRSDRKNVTNDFRINFCYVFVHAKTTLSMNARKCRIKEDFNQNGSLSIS